MDRILEPELMEGHEQAEAYAGADFEEPHGRILSEFDREFSGVEISGAILDLGCGPGDVTFRFVRRFPQATVLGIDGSAAMITEANKRKEREPEVARRIEFLEGFIPGAPIPRKPYDLILSTSFLHHLHSPEVLWQTIGEYAISGTRVFIYDLFRPKDRDEARRLVETYSGDEPEILKRDYFNSLLAAFEPAEVEEQLARTGLAGLTVRTITDRHMIVAGELQ